MRAIIRISPLVLAVLVVACGGTREGNAGRAVAVKVVAAAVDSAAQGVCYTGLIEESSGVALSFSTSGTVHRLSVDAGTRVAAGQEIGVLDGNVQGSMVETAQSALATCTESLRQAEDMYDRMHELYAAGSLTAVQWVDVETKVAQAREAVKAAQAQVSIAQKSEADCRLTAPFAGYISRKMVSVGENVVAGMPVVRLVDIARVKARCSVPEGEIESIKVGQTLRVQVPALANAVFSGTVSEKDVSADALSRTYSVAVMVDNSSAALLPGMLCTISSAGEQDAAVVIPARVVLIDDDNQPFVWTVSGDKAAKKYISLGANRGEMVVVTAGLSAAEQVISDGSQKVSEGTAVAIIK